VSRFARSSLVAPAGDAGRWSQQTTAPEEERAKRLFRVTHPFHPLHGRAYELLELRSSWGENRVYFHDETEQVRRIPAAWTDVVGEDPFVAIATGRSPLHVGDLVRLADVVERLRREEGRDV
jgi:hypothetical protein